MQTCTLVEQSTGSGTGRWAVRILGDDRPLDVGLSRGAAMRRADDVMEELSQGLDQWDAYCNIANGDPSFILFRMV